jgi:hypothetical protein
MSTERFTAEERRLLARVLDEIVPSRPDGKLPGAGQLGVAEHVERAVRNQAEVRSMIVQGLRALDTLARQRKGQEFAALSRADKVALLNEQTFVFPLMLNAYVGYYQHPRVVAALGLDPRPPHPEGYAMEPNDLTLLDPVRRRSTMCRSC